MIHTFTSTLHSLAHTCSGFGSYMMNLQSRCLKRMGNGGCEGGPTVDEAQRDYLRMLDAANRHFDHI